ncbi:hypothetical protein B0H15DRAFT_477141 [Mycena belliarum]|uniref:Uncharacterized protein n=1 Tax=Mycena belliarum TaxID=1033014 RepID=A0AAD6TYH5_9AGAR|nr:hypothetical protein B0H15DRAFT_477141 [Mycena belliae]
MPYAALLSYLRCKSRTKVSIRLAVCTDAQVPLIELQPEQILMMVAEQRQLLCCLCWISAVGKKRVRDDTQWDAEPGYVHSGTSRSQHPGRNWAAAKRLRMRRRNPKINAGAPGRHARHPRGRRTVPLHPGIESSALRIVMAGARGAQLGSCRSITAWIARGESLEEMYERCDDARASRRGQAHSEVYVRFRSKSVAIRCDFVFGLVEFFEHCLPWDETGPKENDSY